MFENDAKGWFGSYSVAGRNSAEKYHIIVHKEEILNGEKKKIIIKDIFTPDEPQQVESLEDNLDIFKVYSSENKDKIGVISKSQNKKPLIN
jgi:5'(3')-deoxyribonucleotidase